MPMAFHLLEVRVWWPCGDRTHDLRIKVLSELSAHHETQST